MRNFLLSMTFIRADRNNKQIIIMAGLPNCFVVTLGPSMAVYTFNACTLLCDNFVCAQNCFGRFTWLRPCSICEFNLLVATFAFTKCFNALRFLLQVSKFLVESNRRFALVVAWLCVKGNCLSLERADFDWCF